MKNIFVTLILFFSVGILFAQNRDLGADMHTRAIDLHEKALSFGLTQAQFDAIKDQAYANPEFISGVIYQDDKPLRSGVEMRYNAYADEIEMKGSSTGEVGALVKDPSIFVKMADDFYIFIPFEGSNEKGGYFNVLHEGERFSLYKKVTATFREAQIAQSTYGRDTPPAFPKTTTYYLVDNGTFYQLPNRKSQVQKVFDKSQKEMKDYVKNNKLDLTNESDLVKATEFYDSLLSE